MDKFIFGGLEINKVNFAQLLFNKTMLFSYMLIALAIFGVFDVYGIRYFSPAVNAHALGLDPTNVALKAAMKTAIFGQVGEISREVPWTLYIVNYMYMIYTGGGIIFLIALAELLHLKVFAKVAASFMVVGLGMVFAGLFTISMDLNMLNMLAMFTSSNYNAGMWLMLPLYSIYIPFVLLEIYLLLTNNRNWARKFALPILILSIAVDLVMYYVQAKLFSMNTARHLWTEFPSLMLYFIISAFIASLGVMGVISTIIHKSYHTEYKQIMEYIRQALLVFVIILSVYEVIVYMSVDKDWAFIILFGEFKTLYFVGYIFLALVLPYLLILKRRNEFFVLMAAISAMIGCYIGRYIFVYGGTANPLSNRFGNGFERYDLYSVASTFNYVNPHLGEVLIVAGSIGIVIAVYKLFDTLFSVSKLQENHQ